MNSCWRHKNKFSKLIEKGRFECKWVNIIFFLNMQLFGYTLLNAHFVNIVMC